jgi:CheY-like chemotaxis protein/LmbE family N-acetylglucosaminyl deacetylase
MATPPENPDSSPPTARPVLLVEDDLDHAHLLRFLLEATGQYQVTLAQDGIRGSELAARGDWALIITDLNLPGAYGQAVIEVSRRTHPATPILATTGHTGPEYGDDALNRGADRVLLKPLDRDELLTAVIQLVEGTELELLPAESPTRPEVEDTSPRAREPSRQVLAVGIRPGEIEAGVGGVLLRHAARGDRIMSLLLSTGSTDDEPDREPREQAKAAGGILGATAFVGSASLEVEKEFQKSARDILGKVLGGIRPDILYLPTPNRQDVRSASLFDLAMKLGADVPLVFCYDSGDSSEAFRPTVFVATTSFLKGKEEAVACFGFPSDHILGPKQLPARARQWAGRAGGRSVEPLEAVRGSEPWPGASATS